MKKTIVPGLLVIIAILLGVIITMSFKKDTTSTNTTNKRNETNNSKVEKNDDYITSGEAIDIALKDVGVSEKDVYDLDVELEYKYGHTVYEVDFDYERYEYEYYIDAENGSIVKSFRERD